MWFGLITLFPEMFSAVQEHGVVGRAVEAGRVNLDFLNPRDFAKDRHRTVDDRTLRWRAWYAHEGSTTSGCNSGGA